jgi:predicted alpha/beta-hydrolase family hydrolase
VTARITFSTKRPSRGYETEKQELRAARDELVAEAGAPVALIGRSFGGRMCAFLAAGEPPDALVILGHPISPPGRPRPADEAALLGIRCPTLVVQGDRDELGPLAILERIAGQNPRIDLVVLRGAAHEYGAHEAEAIEAAARWLTSLLRA